MTLCNLITSRSETSKSLKLILFHIAHPCLEVVNIFKLFKHYLGLAQLIERVVWDDEAEGLSPSFETKF